MICKHSTYITYGISRIDIDINNIVHIKDSVCFCLRYIYIYVHVFLSCLIHNFHTYGHMDKGNELQVRFPSSESLISQVVHGTRFLGV